MSSPLPPKKNPGAGCSKADKLDPNFLTACLEIFLQISCLDQYRSFLLRSFEINRRAEIYINYKTAG
jgi:hypothetical protein